MSCVFKLQYPKMYGGNHVNVFVTKVYIYN